MTTPDGRHIVVLRDPYPDEFSMHHAYDPVMEWEVVVGCIHEECIDEVKNDLNTYIEHLLERRVLVAISDEETSWVIQQWLNANGNPVPFGNLLSRWRRDIHLEDVMVLNRRLRVRSLN